MGSERMNIMNSDAAHFAEIDRLATRVAQLECELAEAQPKGILLLNYQGPLFLRPLHRGIVLVDMARGDGHLEMILAEQVGYNAAMGWTGRVRLRIELLDGARGES